jgi:LysR family transcriptional regulator, hydrogen peroxide-inducible genes activator
MVSMNIQQMQYVLALADQRHFEAAAERCFVTQSTLSTMILKLEEELGITIFDRKKKPVGISAEGQIVVNQLQRIIKEIDSLNAIAAELKGEISGVLKIAVIPTVAPFLLPLFLPQFARQFPQLHIEVREQTTDEILRAIKSRDLDIGIVSLPVHDETMVEYPLYDEPFVYFDAGRKNAKVMDLQKMKMDNLCLLEEGHCMRTQILELCDMVKHAINNKMNFNYKAGSIDGLMRFVRANRGATLLPWLAAMDLNDKEQSQVSRLASPVPFRSIGLIVHGHFVRHSIRELLQKQIVKAVQGRIPRMGDRAHMLSPK